MTSRSERQGKTTIVKMWKWYSLFLLLAVFPDLGKTFTELEVYFRPCFLYNLSHFSSRPRFFSRVTFRVHAKFQSRMRGHNDFDNSIRSLWHLRSNSASFRDLRVPDGADIRGFRSWVAVAARLCGTRCQVVACHSSCVRWRRLFRAVLDFSFQRT